MMEFDFDSVMFSDGGGTLTYSPEPTPCLMHDPEHDVLVDGTPYKEQTDWQVLTGYTGQYGYNGPVMHESEYLGGRLLEDIKSNRGHYVCLVVDDMDDLDSPAGWAVLYRPSCCDVVCDC